MSTRARWPLWLMMCLAVGGVLWTATMGCATPQEQGDQALEAGDAARAMMYYEQAIEDGSRDPELYYRAARAAQQQGAFARAERYFSKSLRYGGGNDVARALAEFYIQTSNFSQAVRVFQYLTHVEDDIQPLYTNMGTALMYGGKYLDAESHLLLAQQMAPEEAVPYINLGVLYDRHLRNRPRAVRFYECYVQLSQDSAQARTVRTRLREIENEGPVDTSRVGLECGQEYRVQQPEEHDLAEIFNMDSQTRTDEVIEIEGSNDGKTWISELPLDYDPEGTPSDSIGDDSERVGQETDDGDDRQPIVDRPFDAQAGNDYEQWKEGYEAGRYDEVVEAVERRRDSGAQLQPEEKKILGKSYHGVGRFEDAASVLEEVLEQRPQPDVVDKLFAIYTHLEDSEAKAAICDRFSGWPDYEDVLEACH